MKVRSIISKKRTSQVSVGSFRNELQKVREELASMMKQLEQAKSDLHEMQDPLKSMNKQVYDVSSGWELTQERLQQHAEEQIVDVPVPQVHEELVEVIQPSPQVRISDPPLE